MRKFRALDLFSGGGGAAVGIYNAGFSEIVGIDIKPRPNYPYDFIQADIHDLPVDIHDFDFIWASPPCQAFTTANNRWKTDIHYPNLIPKTREVLSDHPFTCIENVPTAPLHKSLTLCGSQFTHQGIGVTPERDGIWRKRIFELSFFAWQPPIPKMPFGRIMTITGSFGASNIYYKRKAAGLPGCLSKNHAKLLMGIPLCLKMTRKEIAESVPPPYAEYIATEVLRQLKK